MKVAISTSSFAINDSAPLSLLKSSGVEIVSNPYGRKLTESEIINHLNGVDGLLAGLEPLNANVFSNSPQLKAIARIGIGIDNIDLVAAEESGIKISNTPDEPTNAVAEMTLAAALVLSRNIISVNADLHNNIWKKSMGFGLKNTSILFIGYGRIGQKTAKLFQDLGAVIMVYDPAIEKKDLNLGEKLVTLDKGIQLADIITLHAGGRKPILSLEKFEMMKENVMILNSARGDLIDEESLIEALDSGKVSSAWLDVYSQEPYYGKLTKYDQVLLTPHMSTYTIQCRRDMEIAAVNNLLRDLEISL